MCQQRVSKAASVCGDAEKKGGERRSRASIARRSRTRSHARKPPVSGRTLHGDERGAERRERQQRLAARHTREHHRAPAREKSTARRGCVRRAAVPFPAIRGARSTVESASLRNARVARASLRTARVTSWCGSSCGGGRTLADPMLARSKERKSQLSVFRDCPALAMGVIFFRFTTQRAVGFSESEKAGGARRDETSASARFGREGEFRVTGARAEAAAGPERLPRLPRRFTRVRRIDAPLHAKAGAARPHDRSR